MAVIILHAMTGAKKTLLRARPLALWLLLGAGVLGAGTWGWSEFFHDRFFPRRFAEVEPGLLYRSGRIHPALVQDVLQNRGIQTVIDLSGSSPQRADTAAEIAACQALNITRHEVPLAGDGTGEVAGYVRAMTLLHESLSDGRPALVHCASGVSRTGGVLAAYQLLVQKRDPADVRRDLLAGGHNPRRNPQLIPFLNRHLEEMARALVEGKILDRLPDPVPQLTP